MFANTRAVIGDNRPPTLTEEIEERRADLLADIAELVATELPMLITSDDVAAQVSAVGRDATALLGKLKKAHAEEKEPHLRAGQEVDAWNRSVSNTLNTFLSECRTLVGSWQDKKEAAERAAREAEARQKAAEAERLAEQAMATMAPAAMDRAAQAAAAAQAAEQATTVKTAEIARVSAGGRVMASRSVKWTYEVSALADVPRQYLMINDAAVKAAIAGQNGLREIPGLHIYEDKRTTFR